MKIILTILFFLGFSGLFSDRVQNNSGNKNLQSLNNEAQKDSRPIKEKPLVLVELFTSEGCISCPPADRVLSQLEKEQPNPDAEIITLAMHVDYWNTAAWKDRFSSPMYSQRQEIYGQKFKLDSVYTPQMIVDGAKQFVGTNLNEINKSVSESAKTPKAKIEIAGAGNHLKVIISSVPAHADATVFLAIAEDGLSTKVAGGENNGRTLEHGSVVRELKPLGRIVSTDNKFETETVLQLQPDWKNENLKTIVFLQENQSRKILGINKTLLDKK